MTKPVHNMLQILLLMACLSTPLTMMAQDVQQSQVEMEQNQISIAVVNGVGLRVKNAEGHVLEIFSLTGNKVYTQRIESTSKTVELNHLQRGYYIVRIGKFSRKIYLP